MSKANIETRIERLEGQVNGEGLEGDLYDADGNQVTDARIIRFPTRTTAGLAIMPDGARREICANVMLIDIIKCRTRQATGEAEIPTLTDEERAARGAKYRDMLHLRVDGKPGIMERILSPHHGRVAERGEV